MEIVKQSAAENEGSELIVSVPSTFSERVLNYVQQLITFRMDMQWHAMGTNTHYLYVEIFN